LKAIHYTLRASQKLKALRDHSAKEFDPDTAVAYIAGIRGAIELLAKIQLGDHVRDRPNVRRWRHASHWIYYRCNEETDELVVMDVVGTVQHQP
jgi:plasmid stabilization system protein ParE